jgi:hypothetical protein
MSRICVRSFSEMLMGKVIAVNTGRGMDLLEGVTMIIIMIEVLEDTKDLKEIFKGVEVMVEVNLLPET